MQAYGLAGRPVEASNMVLAGYHLQFEITDTDTYHVGEGVDGTPANNNYFGQADLSILAVQPLDANATVDAGCVVVDDKEGNPIPGDPLTATSVLTKDVVYWPGPHQTIKFSALTRVRVILG